MAYFVFVKDNKSLYKIFSDQTSLNNSHGFNESYIIKEVTDSIFNDVKLGIKEVSLDNEYNLNFINLLTTNNGVGVTKESNITENINNYLNIITDFLNQKDKINHPEYSNWLNFKNTLLKYKNNKELYSNLIYPLNMTFLQFLESKGETVFNTLQIP
jgi:hypothetical protein